MNQENDHDALWELLGQAKQPAVSPFFARNVLREIRSTPQAGAGVLAWLMRHWKLPAMATCALALAASAMVTHQRPSEDTQLAVIAERVSSSPDYHVIGHLDELLDTEQNSVWLSADAN